MARIRSKLDKLTKEVDRVVAERNKEICRRIVALGYDVDHALMYFPIDRPCARRRLEIKLEYEELHIEYPFSAITEGQYACGMYPQIVIEHVHWMLDEVGVPSVEEIELYREYLLCVHPELSSEFLWLERKWRQLSGAK